MLAEPEVRVVVADMVVVEQVDPPLRFTDLVQLFQQPEMDSLMARVALAVFHRVAEGYQALPEQ